MKLIVISACLTLLIIHAACSPSNRASCRVVERPTAAEVPESHQLWNTTFEDYNPVAWIVECTGPKCDPQLPNSLKFNNKEQGIDRRRARVCMKRLTFDVRSDGYPLNPAGRTGIKERGILKRWGPNHLLKVALLSGTNQDGKILMSKNGAEVKIPERFVDSMDDSWYDEETQEKIVSYLSDKSGSAEKAQKLIKAAQKSAKEVFSGNIPTLFNTDHAWVEVHMRAIDCKHSKEYCDAVADALSEQQFKWINPNETVSMDNVAQKQHLMGQERMSEFKLQQYGAFCEAEKNKAKLRIAGMATGTAIQTGMTAFGIYGAYILSVGSALAFGIAAAFPILFLIPFGVLVGLSIRDYLRC